MGERNVLSASYIILRWRNSRRLPSFERTRRAVIDYNNSSASAPSFTVCVREMFNYASNYRGGGWVTDEELVQRHFMI